MENWFWPQYTIAVLILVNFALGMYKVHLEPSKVEAVARIVAMLLVHPFYVFVLYTGGFF